MCVCLFDSFSIGSRTKDWGVAGSAETACWWQQGKDAKEGWWCWWWWWWRNNRANVWLISFTDELEKDVFMTTAVYARALQRWISFVAEGIKKKVCFVSRNWYCKLWPCALFISISSLFLLGLNQIDTSENNFTVAWFANDLLQADGLVTFPHQSLTEQLFKQAWLGPDWAGQISKTWGEGRNITAVEQCLDPQGCRYRSRREQRLKRERE